MAYVIDDNSKDLYTLSFKLKNRKKNIIKTSINLPFI